MQIYLIRHGQTQWNHLGKYQGSVDIPLSDEGKAMLKQADFCPSEVYVTHLQRTKQTAGIIFPGVKQIEADDLREMCFGDFEGRSYKDMEHDPAYRSWVDSGCITACPNGEDRVQFADRIEAQFDLLMREAACAGKDTLVIVAHGGTQMALLERFCTPHKEYYEWLASNGCGYLLDGSRWETQRQLKVVREVSYV